MRPRQDGTQLKGVSLENPLKKIVYVKVNGGRDSGSREEEKSSNSPQLV